MAAPNELATLVGKNIQTRRKLIGLTQAQLAELIGVGQQGLSRMECGNIEPKFERIQQLATVLHCAPGDFFYEMTVEAEGNDKGLVQRIECNLRDLNEREKAAVVRMVCDMSDVFRKTRSY